MKLESGLHEPCRYRKVDVEPCSDGAPSCLGSVFVRLVLNLFCQTSVQRDIFETGIRNYYAV